MSKISVFIVDDHQLVREGFKAILADLSDSIDITGEAVNGRDLLRQLSSGLPPPDIVLMDVNMPDLNGIKTTETLNKDYPDIQVIALSMMKQSVHIRQMLKAGARGYLLKDCNKQELQRAIQQVHQGDTYFSFEVKDLVMQHLTKRSGPSHENLSDRELEVLALIARDYSNREIADALFISPRTVDAHKQNILRKTGVKSMAGLVVFAIKHNLVDFPA
jgi:DNA-binding NarL/FixJ family response regulator